MNRIVRRLRWRLARRIAPVPIMAQPDHEGPAILLSGNAEYQAWLYPKTLDVKVETPMVVRRFGQEPTYERPRQTGTITGTI